MLDQLAKYFFIAITSLVVLQEMLRLIRQFFDSPFLRYKRFEFPSDKWSRVGYHLCVITLGLIVVLEKLNLI